MGVSTDGIIFFGISFKEGEEANWGCIENLENPDKDYYEWNSVYADFKGIKRPTVNYESNRELFSQYYKDVREVNDKSKCNVGLHCSGEYPMRYVALSRTEINAYRGSPQELDPSMFEVSEEEINYLKDFCKVMGIPYSTPKWYLTSYWG